MSKIDKQKIGQMIFALRKNEKITQKEMGDLLGVSEKTIRRWEKGEDVPEMEDIANICNYFHISLEDVFEGKIDDTAEDQMPESSNTDGEDLLADGVDDSDNNRDVLQNNNADDLTWLKLIGIHLLATLFCYFSLVRYIVPFSVCFFVSCIYVVFITYTLLKTKNSTTLLIFTLYFLVIFSNCLIRFYDKPRNLNEFYSLEVMIVNGPIYGLSLLFFRNLNALYWTIIIVYSIWMLLSTMFLIQIFVKNKYNHELTVFNLLYIVLGALLLITFVAVPFCRFDFFGAPQYFTFLTRCSNFSCFVIILSSVLVCLLELSNGKHNAFRKFLHYSLPVTIYLNTHSAIYSFINPNFEYSSYSVLLSGSYLIYIIPILILIVQIIEDCFALKKRLNIDIVKDKVEK